jgi:hypothetical protein
VHGASQGCGSERGILVPSHHGAQDSRLAKRRMHRGSIARPAPSNEQNRPCNHAISQCGQTKSTSPTFERSRNVDTFASVYGSLRNVSASMFT